MKINKRLKVAGIVLLLNLIGYSVFEMTGAFDQINSGDPWTEEIDKEIAAYEKMQLGESYYMVGIREEFAGSAMYNARIEKRALSKYWVWCNLDGYGLKRVEVPSHEIDSMLPERLQSNGRKLLDDLTVYVLSRGELFDDWENGMDYLKISNGYISMIQGKTVEDMMETYLKSGMKMSEFHDEMKQFTLKVNNFCNSARPIVNTK